ncbi:hypothetical protein K458DRAFT_22127 [Lentithecium fluviatile CBS 122367]|uniref:Uncharacterized protein n=1 Tax=Lentithecium fluviatile CBS 122367 TaxID=1168545 RepID=A0A6G1J421_9PLEO|nr:hypothetical protein K458DRAFT_22127 [Lentithecium fluviatile CBS 122367]
MDVLGRVERDGGKDLARWLRNCESESGWSSVWVNVFRFLEHDHAHLHAPLTPRPPALNLRNPTNLRSISSPSAPPQHSEVPNSESASRPSPT